MRSRFLRAAAALLLIGYVSSAHAQTPEQVQALKDNLTPEQQNALLQNSLGKGDTTGKTTDKKLNTPETTTQSTRDSTGDTELIKKRETYDGRILRQTDENPELRPDDMVLIELTPLYTTESGLGPATQNNGNGNNANNSNNGNNANNGNNGNNGDNNNGVNGIPGAVNAANGVAGGNANGGSNNRQNQPLKEKTDEERDKAEKFRQRIQSNNPYQLNRFGVLELPGMPAIPLAGLTAFEATRRLSADPGLSDYMVKLTLLRLLPTGEQALKQFGYDLFKGPPSTFAPVSDIQVPTDYVVGPGDTLQVQLYGNEPAIYELTVQRDGRVNFPKLGPIMVSNMNFDAARAAIEHRVSEQLLGTRVSVTMGNLRSIRVFVLGEAEKPGSYTVSGLSTMTNALFVSGGVKKIGSLRNIELKRNGRLITTLDLYDLLLHGDTSNDRQLLPGDVIFIPPIGRTVAVDGAVKRPAIYELKQENSVAQAIDIAGGLTPDADGTTGQLERILPSGLRQMHNIDLKAADSRAFPVENGDKLHIPEIRPTLENSVELTGYVFRPGKFEYRPGLRLSDVLGSFDELRPTADMHYIMIRREVPPEERIEVVSADLARALAARGSAADVELKSRDKIYVFDLSADRERILAPVVRELELQATPDKPEQIVTVDGRVKAPGHYPLEPAMHVSDLIRAGGSLDDSAFRGSAEITRYSVTEGQSRHTELLAVDLDAIHRGELGADLVLKPYDILVIKPIPMWMEPGSIELAGEVRFPGKYPIHQGETLSSVLQRAGGLTELAFPYGAVFIREELKKREREQMDLLADRLQSDLAALSLEAVVSVGATNTNGGSGSATQALAIGQELMSQLRNTKPVGRLVIDLPRLLKGAKQVPDDVVVRDGDKLLVPKKSQEVTILGEVQSPTSHVFEAGLTLDDYIAKSGGTTQKADRKRIYVVRANGDVVAGGRSGWFRRSQSVEIRPGDTIVIPLDTERVRALPIWQAVTTIIYNLAVALLAVHSVQ